MAEQQSKQWAGQEAHEREIAHAINALLVTARGAPLTDGSVFRVLKVGGMIGRIERFIVANARDEKRMNALLNTAHITNTNPADAKLHDTDHLTPEEQYEVQKRDLYDRALTGDISAKKLWFDLYGELTATMPFNVKVNVIPYTVGDDKLRLIASQSSLHHIREFMKGIKDRFVFDETPHEVREQFEAALTAFYEWGEKAYAPRNG
jgi:hypothetical protein